VRADPVLPAELFSAAICAGLGLVGAIFVHSKKAWWVQTRRKCSQEGYLNTRESPNWADSVLYLL